MTPKETIALLRRHPKACEAMGVEIEDSDPSLAVRAYVLGSHIAGTGSAEDCAIELAAIRGLAEMQCEELGVAVRTFGGPGAWVFESGETTGGPHPSSLEARLAGIEHALSTTRQTPKSDMGSAEA